MRTVGAEGGRTSFHAALWSLTPIFAAGALKKPGVVQWMDRATGCLFLLFAIKLASSRR